MSAGTGVDPDLWEIVVGLEVHAELATRTKLFSSAEPTTAVLSESLRNVIRRNGLS